MAWLSEALAQFPAVRSAILFGSRARGDNRERSDIDLAIDTPGATAVEWSDVVEAIDEAPTLLTLDVLRLDDTTRAMREQIARDGVIVYDARTRVITGRMAS